jgi:hypothetical protein
MAALKAFPILFTIGRMNPVTPGHLRVIEQMIDEAKLRGAPMVYVILSNNMKDPSRNPLPCALKAHLLGTMVRARFGADASMVSIRCVPDGIHFVYQPLETLVDEFPGGQFDFVMFAGEDRAEMADKIRSIKKLAPLMNAEAEMVPLKRTGHVSEYTPGKQPTAQEMSGSFIRDVVLKTKGQPLPERLAVFCSLYEGYLTQEDCVELFRVLDAALQPVSETKKSKGKLGKGTRKHYKK